MPSVLSSRAIATTYEDNKEMLDKIAKHFYYKHGGNFEDLRSEANEYFMECYKKYQDEVVVGNENTRKDKNEYSPFSIYLRQKVNFKFLDKARSIVTKRKGHLQEFGFDTEWLEDKKYFSIESWMADLSDDAKLVANLAIDPPPDVKLTAKTNDAEDFGLDIRAGIVSYLHDIGWSGRRIWKSFDEIKEALIQQ